MRFEQNLERFEPTVIYKTKGHPGATKNEPPGSNWLSDRQRADSNVSISFARIVRYKWFDKISLIAGVDGTESIYNTTCLKSARQSIHLSDDKYAI